MGCVHIKPATYDTMDRSRHPVTECPQIPKLTPLSPVHVARAARAARVVTFEEIVGSSDSVPDVQ